MRKLNTIKSWWVQNTLLPIIILTTCSLTLITAFVYFQNKNETLIRSTLTDQSLSTLTLALARKDRNLVEQVLATLIHTNNFSQIAICENHEALVQYPQTLKSICSEKTSSSHTKSIPGAENLKLVVIYKLRTFELVWPYFLLTISFILIVMFYTYVLSKRLNNDILVPLTTDPTANLDCAIDEIVHVRNKQKQLISEISKAVQNQHQFDLSKKVAHDIRSPLSALKIISQAGKGMDQETKSLLAEVAERIDAIAAKLLKSSTYSLKQTNLLASLTALIREKRINYPLQSFEANISISDNIEPDCSIYDLISVISNIINNAFEASITNSSVTLDINQENRLLHITIRDNGTGIPLHILQILGNEPVTEKKAAGNGLGLFNAYEFVRATNGKIFIKTRPEANGTIVSILLPIKI